MYDAIVIGARASGSTSAMLLARKGYRVLLVDRAKFPSDTVSSHYIHQSGVAYLKRWGMLDPIRQSNCPPIDRMIFDAGPFVLKGSAPAVEGCTHGFAPRRRVLDKILVDGAESAGVEVREAFVVVDLTWENGRVTGVRGISGRKTFTEKAKIVIGADGLRSMVARLVEAPTYNSRETLTCSYYSYWSGLDTEAVELYSRNRRLVVAAPTHDGLTVVTVVWPIQEFERVKNDVEGSFFADVEQFVPQFYERLKAGTQEERFYGTGVLPNFFRKPFGPGWALVGDAGYHRDPFTAQGITNSFQSAEMLASALDNAWSGKLSMESALSGYETKRNRRALPLYQHTLQLASFTPPAPEIQQFLFVIRNNQVETDRFFGVLAGSVDVQDFFSAKNVRKTLGAAGWQFAA